MLKDIFVTPDYHHCTTHPMSDRYFGCNQWGMSCEIITHSGWASVTGCAQLRAGISYRVIPTER